MRTRSHALGRKSRTDRLVAAALAATAMLLAPTVSQGQETQPTQAAQLAEREPVRVTVRNFNWSDVAVYAVTRGTRFRLGTVVTGTAQEFVLPSHLNAEIFPIQFYADPIGGARGVITELLTLNAGDEIEWHVQNHLALSGTVVGG